MEGPVPLPSVPKDLETLDGVPRDATELYAQMEGEEAKLPPRVCVSSSPPHPLSRDTGQFLTNDREECREFSTEIAYAMNQKRTEAACRCAAAQGRPPGLAVVLVGNNPASEIYVRTDQIRPRPGNLFRIHHSARLHLNGGAAGDCRKGPNARAEIDGILVQLPLPAQVDTKRILMAVSPKTWMVSTPAMWGRSGRGVAARCEHARRRGSSSY